MPFGKEEVEGNIGQRLRRLARDIPGTIAIKTSEAAVSYAELDAASDDVARVLLSRRGPAAEPVALLLEEGSRSAAAVLGILKAGKVAVLLSPDFQTPRLAAIWEDAQKPLVLADRSTYSLAESFASESGQILNLDEPQQRITVLSDAPIDPGTLAVISYTTGTTGEPKGVMWSHRFVLQYALYNHDRYRLSEEDRFLCVSAYGFGASLIQSLTALLNGTTLYLRNPQAYELKSLLEWLRREQMNILHFTSFGLLRKLVGDASARVDLPDLRLVLLSGEELPRRDFERFRAFFPKSVEYSYRLAGSEALMMCESRIDPETVISGEKVPAGYIVPDKELLLLDPAAKAVPAGQMGEIAIRSRYLAEGYWRQPDLTRAKFLPDPEGGDRRIFLSGDMGQLMPDGQLLYLGRKDNIVRVRGFNIQLEAVEAALKQLPAIKDAAAGAHSLQGSEKRLVAYLIPETGQKSSIGQIHNHLMPLLPAYMIPTVYVFLDALPRNPMGRLDRQDLPPPGSGRPDLDVPFVHPRDELERRLCLLWSETIGVERVGIDDDFFLLGGDSLLAMHMVLHVEEQLNRSIPSTFFRTPTIHHLVEIWQSEEKKVVAGSNHRTKDALSGGKSPTRWKASALSKAKYNAPRSKKGPKLYRRIVRLAVEFITANLSYAQGCRWLSWWCRQPFVIEHFYPADKMLFRRWVHRLGGCPQAPAEALTISVMSNIIWSKNLQRTVPYKYDTFLESMRHSYARFFRDLARIISEAPPEVLDRFFDTEGLEHVEEAQRQGRGVILLTYHGVCNRFSNAALPRLLHGSPIPTIGPTQGQMLARKNQIDSNLEANEPAILANVAVEGLRFLKQGGIVQIAPDIGYNASEGVPVSISGFRFLMKPGFAELALLSDAVVIPCYTTRSIDGRIHSHFDPPLDPGNATQDRQARISHLLEQYAAFVGNAWRKAPESLLSHAIRKHLQRPTAEV